MGQKNILVMASLDTKGEAAKFLIECIVQLGHKPLVMDLSMLKEPKLKADISSLEVALAGGGSASDTRGETGERAKRQEIFTKGATKIASDLLNEGKIDGLVALGGATNTLVASNVCQKLPFGFPKLILSSTAGMGKYNYIGRSDIALFATVVDTDSMNLFLKNSIIRAAHMICAAVESGARPISEETDDLKKAGTKVIAMTQLNSAQCCANIITILKSKGNYEVITFHGTGIGDSVMEELIESGTKFDAVLDVCVAGLSEYLMGGNRAAIPTRLEAAGKMGIPQILTPCSLDIISCGPMSRKDKGDPLWEKRRLKERKLWSMDDLRVSAKISAEEAVEIAKAVASKLNRAKAPVKFLVPLKGWHIADQAGQSLYQPEINKLLIDTLKKEINSDVVEIREVDLYLNTYEFASVMVDALEEVLAQFKGTAKNKK